MVSKKAESGAYFISEIQDRGPNDTRVIGNGAGDSNALSLVAEEEHGVDVGVNYNGVAASGNIEGVLDSRVGVCAGHVDSANLNKLKLDRDDGVACNNNGIDGGERRIVRGTGPSPDPVSWFRGGDEGNYGAFVNSIGAWSGLNSPVADSDYAELVLVECGGIDVVIAQIDLASVKEIVGSRGACIETRCDGGFVSGVECGAVCILSCGDLAEEVIAATCRSWHI
jgi:hypothetical protein